MSLMLLLACSGTTIAPPAEVWEYDSAAPPLMVYRIAGERYDDGLGESLAAGDVDGDGWSEVAIGAPFSPAAGHWAGTAYLFGASMLGDEDQVSIGNAQASWVGEATRDLMAGAISMAPGLTHDGTDLLLGARYNDRGGTAAGRAYLVSLGSGPSGQEDVGAARWVFTGEASGDYAGEAVLGAGDVDGGGIGDLLIGAPGSDEDASRGGKVYLLRGEALGVVGEVALSSASRSWTGQVAAGELGVGLHTLGDVSGDGLPDVAMVATGEDEAGEIYLLTAEELSASGSGEASQLEQLASARTGDRCGQALAGGEDLDGDGLDDVFVGCPGDDEGGTDAGAVYVYSGANRSTPMVQLQGGGAQGAGAGLAVGDVDGDAVVDILVGAPTSSRAWVVLGAELDSGSVELSDSAWSLEAEEGSGLGTRVLLPDLDGDGRRDPLLTAPDHMGGTGMLYVIFANGLQRNGVLELE